MIRHDEIAIVVQGGILDLTVDVLKSLRNCFPGAEIILSTWECSEIAGLDYDKAVLSKDPGSELCDEKAGTYNNVNRQLVSIKAGLAQVSRKYILKVRTDIVFHGASFLEYFGKYDEKKPRYFANRLLICSFYTRNPRIFRLCFHPSDWIVFGNADDVRNYYCNTELMSREDMLFFKNHKKSMAVYVNYLSRFTPEQYIFLGFLRQHENVEIDCYYDSSKKLIKQSEKALADCFVVLDYGKQLEVEFCKYPPNRYSERYSLISFFRWKGLYEKYIRGQFSAAWISYRLNGFFLQILAGVRKLLVRFLDFLGIKEKVKKILGRKS